MGNNKEKLILFLISAFIILLSVLPLFRNDFVLTDDSNLYPTFLYEFDTGIKAGHLLPRWSADFWLGLGSPLFNFNQPLFFYLAEFFHLLGFGLVTSIKATVILGMALGFFFMYLFAKSIWGKEGGFISAVVFTFYPYHLALVYIRGAFAEFFALSLIPMILFSFLRLAQTKKLGYFLLSSLSLALLILEHNIVALFFSPLLVVYLIVIFWKDFKKKIIIFGLAIIVSFNLAAFFIGPAFYELKYLGVEGVTTGKFDFHNNFLKIKDFFLFEWSDAKYFQLGIISLIIIVAVLFILGFRRKNLNEFEKKNLFFFFIIFLFSSFLTLSVSTFIWENIPIINYIQFPWRLIGFQAIAFGIMGGVLLKHDFLKLFFKERPVFLWLIFIFSTIIILANISFTQPPRVYIEITSDELYHPAYQIFEDKKNTKTFKVSGELNYKVNFLYSFGSLPCILPKGVSCQMVKDHILNSVKPVLFSLDKEKQKTLIKKAVVSQGEANLVISQPDPYEVKINIAAVKESKIQINQFWFPGWHAFLDSREVSIDHNNKFQFMTFMVPVGNHELILRFLNTPVRSISEIISLAGWFIWLGLLIIWLIRWVIKKVIKENYVEDSY